MSIPIFKPHCCELEIEAVTKVLESRWWGLGPKVEEFEEKFARYVGVQYAVAVNSGTAALQLALKVLDVKDTERDPFPWEERKQKQVSYVAVPALTFISTALAVVYNKLCPWITDIDEETLNLNPYDLDTSQRLKVVMPVHYAGRLFEWPNARYFSLIEDCAHAAGTKGAGQQGELACWSFHAVKNLATGDGGMITTNNKHHYERLKSLRWCGINKSTWDREQGRYGWDYDVQEVVYKCHMNDINAALGLAQLRHLDYLNTQRKRLVQNYNLQLRTMSQIILPKWDPDMSWHMYVIRVPAQVRDRFVDHMLTNDVAVGVHYKPLQHYPMFASYRETPIAERVWKELVTLPLYPDMTIKEQEVVVKAVKSFLF